MKGAGTRQPGRESHAQLLVLAYTFKFRSIIKPFFRTAICQPFLKTSTFYLCRFTTRPSLLAASLRMLSCCWRPITVYERRTTSSAKRIIGIWKSFGNNVIPCLPFCMISLASSLMKRKQTRATYFKPRGHNYTSLCYITTYTNSCFDNIVHTSYSPIHIISLLNHSS